MSKVKYTKPYVTTAEAALITGFNQRFLQRQCQEGAIEGAQKMGNTWVIPTGWACERMESYAPHDGVVSLLDAACTAGVSRQTIVFQLTRLREARHLDHIDIYRSFGFN